MLDKWSLASRDEEQLVLQQFLRFGETKTIAHDIIAQEAREQRDRHAAAVAASSTTPSSLASSSFLGAGGAGASLRTAESDIKKFIERSGNVGGG